MRLVLVRAASLTAAGVALGCGWFVLMELLFRHHGYIWRALIATAIVVEAALTFAVSEELFEPAPFRWTLIVGAVPTAVLGCWIVAEDLARPGLPARPHFEGYLLIIGAALIVYGLLTAAAMLTAAPARFPPVSAPRS